MENKHFCLDSPMMTIVPNLNKTLKVAMKYTQLAIIIRRNEWKEEQERDNYNNFSNLRLMLGHHRLHYFITLRKN